MSNIAYYHLYLTEDPGIWSSILLEQFSCLENSGLMENLDKLNIVLLSKEDSRIALATELLATYDVVKDIGYAVSNFRNDYNMLYKFKDDLHDDQTECITLSKLYADCMNCSDDTNVLYFHSKGITSNFSNLALGKIKEHRQVHYWRNLMNWGLISNWKICLDVLKDYDIVGINYTTNGMLKFYTGNFWWTKAHHIKRLPDPGGKLWDDEWNKMRKGNMKRVKDEVWVCSHPDTRSYDLFEEENSAMHNLSTPLYQLDNRIKMIRRS